MAISSAATKLPGALLPEWQLLLQEWSPSGRLTAAANEALLLDGELQALKDLVSQWTLGDFQVVTEIVLLSNAKINSALGAYTQCTGNIYLNADRVGFHRPLPQALIQKNLRDRRTYWQYWANTGALVTALTHAPDQESIPSKSERTQYTVNSAQPPSTSAKSRLKIEMSISTQNTE